MRLIDADALIENESWDADTRAGYVQVVDVGSILEAPTVDPVKHGYWISKCEGTYSRWRLYCSVCGKHSGLVKEKPYCPNCGAKMDDKSKVL